MNTKALMNSKFFKFVFMPLLFVFFIIQIYQHGYQFGQWLY